MKYHASALLACSLLSMNDAFRCLCVAFLALPIAHGYGQVDTNDSSSNVLDNVTPTWQETIDNFQSMSVDSEFASLVEVGSSDVGRPIHAFVLSNRARDLKSLNDLRKLHIDRNADGAKACLLINNAIHPGEPCGVNASIAWAREMLNDGQGLRDLLTSMDVVIVPMYNVGGALNRNCCTRTNQEGPEEYGFRGNARNLDLNRDFIKMDSQNARSFVALFQAINPDVFIDTHTSNGADYTYAMTLITTQADKAGPVIGPYLREVMEPHIFESMEQRGETIVPYVNTRNQTPESGIIGFLESPRYSTGYTTLFGTLGFTAEAHMLKPFPKRVAATLDLIQCIALFTAENAAEIIRLRAVEADRVKNAFELPVHWALDATDSIMIPFKGYTARREVSQVTGDIRLAYDREQTWERQIPWFNRFLPDETGQLPEFYVVPQAWREVVDRCQWNGIEMTQLSADTIMELEVTYIRGFDARNAPYEGHHINRLDSLESRAERVRLFKGDWLVPTEQIGARYLIETLDPRGHDSFFTWNFFDSALQQKEYFSAYVFEETALEMLQSNAELRIRFDAEKASNPEIAGSSRAQLNWLHMNSANYEGTVNRYPVFQSITKRH